MAHSIKLAVAEGTFAGFAKGKRTVGDVEVDLAIVPMNSAEEIGRHTADADGVILGLQRLGKEELPHLGQGVRAVSRAGIGLDSIDLEAAQSRGIAVIYQPDYATTEVATHAVALLMAVNRKLMIGDAVARRGWKGRRSLGRIPPLDELTVGIVGAGAIGKATIARLLPLVGRVVYFDPFARDVPAGAEPCDSLDALLAVSHAISLHAPLVAETRHLIGAEQLARLPEGAILINVARGELVDMEALLAALRDGRLAGAGLDVFEQEPFPPDHPITQFESVLLTPHVGFLSSRSVERLERQAIGDLVSFLVEGKIYGGKLAVSP